MKRVWLLLIVILFVEANLCWAEGVPAKTVDVSAVRDQINQNVETVKANIGTTRDNIITNLNTQLANNPETLNNTVSNINNIANTAVSNLTTLQNNINTNLDNIQSKLNNSTTPASTPTTNTQFSYDDLRTRMNSYYDQREVSLETSRQNQLDFFSEYLADNPETKENVLGNVNKFFDNAEAQLDTNRTTVMNTIDKTEENYNQLSTTTLSPGEDIINTAPENAQFSYDDLRTRMNSYYDQREASLETSRQNQISFFSEQFADNPETKENVLGNVNKFFDNAEAQLDTNRTTVLSNIDKLEENYNNLQEKEEKTE